MQCVLLFAIIVVASLWPLGHMLFGRGPNSFRRLARPDLAAFFVLTAGIACALAIARNGTAGSGIVLLVFTLPFALAFAWVGRYFIEDTFGFCFRRSSHRTREADLSFLSKTFEEPLDVTLVEVERPEAGASNGSSDADA